MLILQECNQEILRLVCWTSNFFCVHENYIEMKSKKILYIFYLKIFLQIAWNTGFAMIIEEK